MSEPVITATQESLKNIIAANIADLRRTYNMTQADLAARLNYTDKAISKWERAESTPDITVLKSIADLFDVTVDYLLVATHELPPAPEPVSEASTERNIRTRGVVTGISILLVWLVATVLFVIFGTVNISPSIKWLVFAYAVPASFLLWLILNSIWFDRRRNYLIISLLMWSVLMVTYLSVWSFAMQHIWMLFLLGIPGQAIILLWSRLKKRTP